VPGLWAGNPPRRPLLPGQQLRRIKRREPGMTLLEARQNIGRLVIYRPMRRKTKERGDEGVITSVNDTYVFVRYGTQQTSEATRPEDLRLSHL
jgi:hypothetical protein